MVFTCLLLFYYFSKMGGFLYTTKSGREIRIAVLPSKECSNQPFVTYLQYSVVVSFAGARGLSVVNPAHNPRACHSLYGSHLDGPCTSRLAANRFLYLGDPPAVDIS